MRMNISVPDELADQVRARDLPISSICQDALRKAVDAAEKKEQIMSNMQAVIERLRGTQDDEKKAAFDAGRELGITWAKDWASATDLQRVAQSDRLTWENNMGFGGDTDANIQEFRDEIQRAGSDYEFNADYADEDTEGFIVGAGEVWDAVKYEL